MIILTYVLTVKKSVLVSETPAPRDETASAPLLPTSLHKIRQVDLRESARNLMVVLRPVRVILQLPMKRLSDQQMRIRYFQLITMKCVNSAAKSARLRFGSWLCMFIKYIRPFSKTTEKSMECEMLQTLFTTNAVFVGRKWCSTTRLSGLISGNTNSASKNTRKSKFNYIKLH